MARRPRLDPPGAWHHVINRGADRQDIFSCDADYLFFEAQLAEAVATHGIEVHAYALMSNHFHLLVRCPEGGLSAAMKDIQSVYVANYNHHHERSGPMYEGRFTSYGVDSPAARHLTGRYVHRNPLDIVPAAALRSYRWSSYPHYVLDTAAPDWLVTAELAGQFQDPRAYERYVLTRQPCDEQADRFGSAAPIGRLDDIDAVVAAVCRVPVEHIHRRTRSNTARMLAVTIAVELRLLDSVGLAAHYGFSEAASVRSLARRGRVRLSDDPTFAALRTAALDPWWRNSTKGA